MPYRQLEVAPIKYLELGVKPCQDQIPRSGVLSHPLPLLRFAMKSAVSVALIAATVVVASPVPVPETEKVSSAVPFNRCSTDGSH